MNSFLKVMGFISDFMGSVDFLDMSWAVTHYWGMFQRAEHRLHLTILATSCH